VLVHVGFGGFGRDQRENEQIHCVGIVLVLCWGWATQSMSG
jgi:hypothetical protein